MRMVRSLVTLPATLRRSQLLTFHLNFPDSDPIHLYRPIDARIIRTPPTLNIYYLRSPCPISLSHSLASLPPRSFSAPTAFRKLCPLTNSGKQYSRSDTLLRHLKQLVCPYGDARAVHEPPPRFAARASTGSVNLVSNSSTLKRASDEQEKEGGGVHDPKPKKRRRTTSVSFSLGARTGSSLEPESEAETTQHDLHDDGVDMDIESDDEDHQEVEAVVSIDLPEAHAPTQPKAITAAERSSKGDAMDVDEVDADEQGAESEGETVISTGTKSSRTQSVV